jgi:YD repeat-containing protein
MHLRRSSPRVNLHSSCARYFAYDELGNPVEAIDGAGVRVRMEVDARGQLLRRSSFGGANTAPIDDRYTYDARGRLVVAKNSHALLRYAYDALDRLVAATDPLAGTAQQTFDADGLRTKTISAPGTALGFTSGRVTHYGYDGRGLLSQIVDAEAGTFTFDHDAAGRRRQ